MKPSCQSARIIARSVLATLIALTPSCFLTNGRGGDGGDAGAPGTDLGTSLVDGGDEGPCLHFGGTTAQCSRVTAPVAADCGRCTVGGCHPLINVCVDAPTSGGGRREDDCSAGGMGCWRDNTVCAHPTDAPLEDFPRESGGYGCVSVGYCLWIAEQDLPDDHPPVSCFYGEGEPVVNGPPEELCPDERGNDRYPLCYGACEARCEAGTCHGMNEERGFGVCATGFQLRCSPERPEELASFLDGCSMLADEPCACMVATPTAREDYGVMTPVSTCRAYREAYPDTVDCRDVDWNPID